MMIDIDQLNRASGIEGAVEFDVHSNGLVRAKLTSSYGKGEVMLHGAHVTRFVPGRGDDVLWMSEKSWFESHKPIRGGVPICFPWFGPKEDNPDAPAHGFARLMDWSVIGTQTLDDQRVRLVLALEDNEQTRDMWNHTFKLTYSVTVGETLELSLKVSNTDAKPMRFTEALHTYLSVGDVKRVSILGVEDTEFVDKVKGSERAKSSHEPITFTAETDRVYLNTSSECVLVDPVGKRRIVIAKSGSMSTVVWNPWVDKARRMVDFGDEEWPGMACVETANAMENAVSLAPGEDHEISTRITVTGL